jgi:hypothetical protein
MGTKPSPPQSYGREGGNGNDSNWDSPLGKNITQPGFPQGWEGDGKLEPPLAGVGGTAEEGGAVGRW